MLTELKVNEFLEQTASGIPVPGGGSVSALSAALGAGLTEMVANLTVKKKGYEAVEARMQDIAEKGRSLRDKLAAAVVLQADLDAAVLASQRRAAQHLGLALEDVRLTDGEFRTARGLPWRYSVNRVCLGDGRCLAIERSPVASAMTEGGGY